MGKFTIEDVRKFVADNLDKRFIIFTYKEEESEEFAGVILSPKTIVKGDLCDAIDLTTLVGMEFTEGFADTAGGQFYAGGVTSEKDLKYGCDGCDHYDYTKEHCSGGSSTRSPYKVNDCDKHTGRRLD